MQAFHAHIYFRPEESGVAQKVRKQFTQAFAGQRPRVGPLEPGLRGPHLLSQFEIDFTEDEMGQVLAWLQRYRSGLSVLVHPEIADELKAHLSDAIWMGLPWPLDFSKLDLRAIAGSFVPYGEKPRELR